MSHFQAVYLLFLLHTVHVTFQSWNNLIAVYCVVEPIFES